MRTTRLFIVSIFFLISAALVSPEDDFIQTLIKRMREHKAKAPQVKVFLSFNQNVYSPGDTAFFAAHFLSDDLLPVAGRQILRVELLDQEGNIMFYEHIAVKEGLGANQLIIPKTLSAGRYQWVSYSEYMKNFDPHFYFRQAFDVVTKSELKVDPNKDLTATIYPEGGSLVEAVLNNLVIYTKNKSFSEYKVLDGVNLVTQGSLSQGLGSFLLTPEKGKRYLVELGGGGQVKQVDLPQVNKTGYSIFASGYDPIQVVVRASKETRARAENLWLVVTAQSDIIYSAPFKFDNLEQITVQLPTKNLPAGIAQVTLFNNNGIVQAERLIYSHPKAPINIELSKDKPSYENRSSVNLAIDTKDELGNPMAGNFSISIINKKLFMDASPKSTIASYLYLSSELASQENISNLTREELDLFMITQKNIRNDWPTVLQGTKSIKHPFRKMVYYSGQAINATTGKPFSDSTRIITYLQKNMIGYEAYTDRNGWFDLAFLFDFWNEDEMFYMMENKRGVEVNGRIKLEEDSLRLATALANESIFKSNYAEYQLQKRLMDQSYNFYSTKANTIENDKIKDPNADFEDELSGADISVKVQDYVVFPTMGELIREIVPTLQHRKMGGNAVVRVVLLQGGQVPANDPLFLIDGIMTKNTDYFLKLKTSDVISIKVIRDINKLNRFGSIGKNGIVLVYTKKETHPELQKVNTQISVKGLSRPLQFRESGDADLRQVRKPNFRSTLYWNPNVQTDAFGKAKVNFYTSDDVGTFLIRIQGITSDGRPFEKTDSLTVSFSGN